eukprot:s1349_g3.t1
MAASSQETRDLDPETEQLLIASYKAKAAKPKPKARARSLDTKPRMKADPRDPRMSADQWPRYNRHIPSAPEANAHRQWITCSVCNVRLLYTPRKGSPASSTAVLNAPELRQHLGNVKPTAKVCLHMMNKITAETVLEKPIREILDNPTATRTAASSPGTAWSTVDDAELVAAYENEKGE